MVRFSKAAARQSFHLPGRGLRRDERAGTSLGSNVAVAFGYFDADGMKDECVISPPTNTGSTTASRAARVHAARQLVAGLSPVWVEASPAALQTAMGNVETAIPVGRPSDWDPETSYMLDAENGLLTLTDQVSVDVDWLFFVIDQTTGESLQWSTAEGNVITLVDLPDDVQDSDSLYIDYRPVSQ